MRKKDETLREQLLGCAREIMAEHGPQAVSIRALAQRAGIAVGTIYNYFSDKDDLLLALTEEYWNRAMEEMESCIEYGDFASQLCDVYAFLRNRTAQSGFVLMHSLRPVESAGRGRMSGMLDVLRCFLLSRLESDQGLGPDIWEDGFTPERFVDFLVDSLLAQLRGRGEHMDCLIAVVRRVLYAAGRPKQQEIA